LRKKNRKKPHPKFALLQKSHRLYWINMDQELIKHDMYDTKDENTEFDPKLAVLPPITDPLPPPPPLLPLLPPPPAAAAAAPAPPAPPPPALSPVVPQVIVYPQNKNVKRWDKIHELVVLAIAGWIVGSSWSHTVTSMFNQIPNAKWRMIGLCIWCIMVTVAFAGMVWLTTEQVE
jgi:hypothetical protein